MNSISISKQICQNTHLQALCAQFLILHTNLRQVSSVGCVILIGRDTCLAVPQDRRTPEDTILDSCFN
jgi:hypothetical protein